MAPISHGSGSRLVARIDSSTPMPLLVACSALVEIQPNRMAATIQPHSTSLNRPTGVLGGTAQARLGRASDVESYLEEASAASSFAAAGER